MLSRNDNVYIPDLMKVISVRQQTPDVKSVSLRFMDAERQWLSHGRVEGARSDFPRRRHCHAADSLRSRYALENRSDYGEIAIVYGARTVADLVYVEELDEWAKRSA